MFEGVTTTYKRTSKFSKQEYQDEEHTIPATSSTITNNMLRYWVQEDEHNLLTDCITVTSNGINSGYVTYQNKMFAIAQDSYALMLHKKGIGELHYLYLMGVMNKKFIRTYDYQNKAVWSRVKGDYIELPVLTTDSTEPYWDYMAYYIHNIQHQYAVQLESKSEYELDLMCQILGVTREDIKERVPYIEPKYTNKFTVGELFEVKSTKKAIHKNTITDFNGKHPYVTRKEGDNGIDSYINEDEQYLNHGNTISLAMDTYVLYYQQTPYFTGNKVKVISFDGIDKETALYMITVVNKTLGDMKWGETMNMDKLNKIELELPVLAPNTKQIDWGAIRHAGVGGGGINYLASRQEICNRDLAIIRQLIQ